MRLGVASGLLLLALAAPARAVVYGTDDRVDPPAEADPALRALAIAGTAALVAPGNLRFGAGGTVAVQAARLADWDAYCAGTPFLDQPTAATCGGVLIDGDLLVTAAHCLSRVPTCHAYAYLFGYAETAANTLAPLDRADVYACRAIAASAESPPDADTHLDFAVVALDRAVDPRFVPVRVAPAGARTAGEAVTTVGFPSGLPLKLDPSMVLDPRPSTLDYFALASDTFQGSSGSGIFDGEGQLVGLFARGTTDFVDRGGCRAPRVVTTVPDPAAAESATYVAPAIAALCAAGWPSARLCGIDPRCGDGICSPLAETPSSCPADCPVPRCGDDLCELAEWDTCPADCSDRRPAGLPDGWFCEAVWYGDGQTCDCGCGVPDPDCGSAGTPQRCDSLGPGGRAPPTGGGGCSVVASRPPGGRIPALAFALVALAVVRRRGSRAADKAATSPRDPAGAPFKAPEKRCAPAGVCSRT